MFDVRLRTFTWTESEAAAEGDTKQMGAMGKRDKLSESEAMAERALVSMRESLQTQSERTMADAREYHDAAGFYA